MQNIFLNYSTYKIGSLVSKKKITVQINPTVLLEMAPTRENSEVLEPTKLDFE